MVRMDTTGCELFTLFKKKEGISADQMPDYIYLCLNTGYRPRKMYGYSNYYTKCKIVLNWKKERKLELKTKLGEAIFGNNLVNFLEDDNHTLNNCNCGSVYWENYW